MKHVLRSLLMPSNFCYRFGKPLAIIKEKWYKLILGKILDQNMQFRNATKLEIGLFQSVQLCF